MNLKQKKAALKKLRGKRLDFLTPGVSHGGIELYDVGEEHAYFKDTSRGHPDFARRYLISEISKVSVNVPRRFEPVWED